MEALLVRVRTGREELPFVRALPCLASVSRLSHSTECARQAVQHQKTRGLPEGNPALHWDGSSRCRQF